MTPPGTGAPLPLFVYGTLMSGMPQAGLVASLSRVKAAVHGQLYSLPAGYPALVPGGDQRVRGELLSTPDARLLALLDQYEGVPEGLFRRARVRALVGLRPLAAWAYVMDDPRLRGGVLLRSGVWTRARRR